jgi:hypothetical protein
MHDFVSGENCVWFAAVMAVQMILCAGMANAQPTRTLPAAYPYKDASVQRLTSETAELMAMSEEQVLAAVPTQAGVLFTDCPNCDKSTVDQGNFAWSPANPDQIVCKDCDAVYPNNPKYPDDQVLEVRSIDGNHHYPYYQRPDGYKIYFRARVDYEARGYMAKACQSLAELYWLTGDEAYARRAAIILVRFAQVYPGYVLHSEYPFTDTKFGPYDGGNLSPHDIPRTSKWHVWGYMDISTEMAYTFDILRSWSPLADMADGRAIAMIRDDLLGGMLDYTMAIEESYSNMSTRKWENAIVTARMIQRPQVIHDVVFRIEQFMNDKFLYDGSWMETSPSYMRQTAGWMQQISLAMKGYEDPAGYRHHVTGERLDAQNIAQVRQASERAMETVNLTRFPNGQLLPVNDTWASTTPSNFASHFSKRESMEPILLPGFGVAVMGGGEGESQYAAYLNFTSGLHHKQRDALSIGLFAGDKELIPDIGYTHTKYRFWATSTASHNTVLVDGHDQQYDPEHRMNRLRLWASDGENFHTAEAESNGVYPQTSRYRRTLMAIGRDAHEAYLVDVFQVHGGSQHDYILTGNADEDSAADVANLDLQTFDGSLMNPGFEFVIPAGESNDDDPQSGLGYIRDPRWAAAGDMVTLNERLIASPDIGKRTRLWPGAGATIYLGNGPSIRRSQGNDSTLNDYLMPMMIARRQGQSLESTFVAVHEPVDGAPRLGDVSAATDRGVVKLQVTHANVVDYIFISLDGPAQANVSSPTGTISFNGTQGFLRVENGQPTEAHLVNGTRLSLGDFELRGQAPITGTVLAAHADPDGDSAGWFEVQGSLPAVADGSLVLIKYPDGTTHGYHVQRVESQSESSRILVREKPAFQHAGENIELTTYPKRTIQGNHVAFEFVQSHHYRQ